MKGAESTNSDRLDYLFLNLVGQVVHVTTIDGVVREGLFAAPSDDQAEVPSIVLSCVRLRESQVHKPEDASELIKDKIFINLSDIVCIDAVAVKFESGETGRGRVDPLRNHPGPMEKLNWAEVGTDEAEALELETEEKRWKPGEWDQFEANKKFGVKSTYNEELYTTKLDKTKLSKEQHQRADAMARDIERTGPTHGVQQRIERGEDIDQDEGELYSDVQRNKIPRATNAYVPPSQRAAKPLPPKQESGMPPAPIEGGSEKHTSPTDAAVAAKATLNAGAKEWKPTVGAAAPITASPTSPQLPSLIIDDMMKTVAGALDKFVTEVKCAADWPGHDSYFDQDVPPPNFSHGGQMPHAAHGGGYQGLIHHHHQHHHHHHNQVQNPQMHQQYPSQFPGYASQNAPMHHHHHHHQMGGHPQNFPGGNGGRQYSGPPHHQAQHGGALPAHHHQHHAMASPHHHHHQQQQHHQQAPSHHHHQQQQPHHVHQSHQHHHHHHAQQHAHMHHVDPMGGVHPSGHVPRPMGRGGAQQPQQPVSTVSSSPPAPVDQSSANNQGPSQASTSSDPRRMMSRGRGMTGPSRDEGPHGPPGSTVAKKKK